MQTPKAILFDLDDTLLSHSIGKELLLTILCQKYASRLQVDTILLRHSIEQASALFWGDPGNHRRGRLDLAWAKQQIIRLGCGDLGLPFDECANEFATEFFERRSEFTKPFHGAIPTLAILKKRGILLGLLTNGAASVQRKKIESHNLTPAFDAIWIEGDRNIGKPDPRAYIGLLRELGAEPETTWMVGDHLEWEVKAAQMVGLYSVWVDHRRTGLPHGCTVKPDRIVYSVAELVE